MASEILKRDQNHITVLGGITDDADQDVEMLRVDPISKRLLIKATFSGSGVSSLNGLTGDVILAAGSNVTITPVGNTLTIASSGGGTGSPGGLNTQIQYNNSGAFGGITGAVTDGTAVSLTAAHLLNPTINGAGTGLATLVYPNTSTSVTTTVPATTGTLALTSQLTSGTVTSVASADGSIIVTNPTTTPDLSVVKSPTLTTGRTISVTGDLAYTSPSFDGSANITAAGTLATVNSNVGSFTNASLTVNGKGLITAASNGTAPVTSVSGTTNRITSTGGATPVIDISATFEALLGKVASPLSQFASTSSTQLAGVISDETGTGALVFANTPTLTTAVLGSSTATTQTPGDSSNKVATTAYVDAAVQGTDAKDACKYGTTAALPTVIYSNGSSGVGATLIAVGLGALSLDGNTPAVNDRVLVKNQVSTFQNGIYNVTTVGNAGVAFVLTRAADFDQSADIDIGDSVFVTNGTVNASTTWVQNGTNSPVMGTDPITFAQIAGPGSITSGNGITVTGLSVAIDTSVTVDKTTAQTLTNKTLTSPILTTPALGTPASGVVTNLTGTAGINITGTAPAGTLTGTTLASNVVTSSLTSVGTLSAGAIPASLITAGTFGSGAYSFGTGNAVTLGTIELGAASDTTLSRSGAGVLSVEGVVVDTVSATNTLTNKRITRRTTTVTQSATPTINSDNMDVAAITGLAQAITSMTTNLTGTPVQNDFLEVQITDNGTARAITWGASFSNGGLVNLPTTTVISTRLRVLLEWDATTKWTCVAVA